MQMYYPYLRGKQFELKALRDYSLENKNEDKILPIIEPVNQSTNVLSLAIDQLKSNGMLFSMIMNPMMETLGTKQFLLIFSH